MIDSNSDSNWKISSPFHSNSDSNKLEKESIPILIPESEFSHLCCPSKTAKFRKLQHWCLTTMSRFGAIFLRPLLESWLPAPGPIQALHPLTVENQLVPSYDASVGLIHHPYRWGLKDGRSAARACKGLYGWILPREMRLHSWVNSPKKVGFGPCLGMMRRPSRALQSPDEYPHWGKKLI